MPDKEEDISSLLDALEGMLKRHRNVFILVVMLVYVLLMAITLFFLVQYIHLRASDPCELCLNMSRITSGAVHNLSIIGGR